MQSSYDNLKLQRHKLAIVRELYVEPLLAPEPAQATVGRVVLHRVAHPDEQRASRAQPPCERDLVRVRVRDRVRVRLRVRLRLSDRVRVGAWVRVRGATDSSIVACTGCAPG